jgi:integrase
LTVKDVDALMQYAADNEPGMVPYMALCLFAGIRTVGEMQRLDWKDIDFKRREVFISDEVSKTGDERIVDMTDTLIAWLAPHRQSEGAIYYTRTRFERIRKGAGVRWAKDCMRHSFGSYHLAMWENMGKTMEQMGHTNARILKNHYRRAVRREDAERFWAIRPKAEGGVIEFPKAQAS